MTPTFLTELSRFIDDFPGTKVRIVGDEYQLLTISLTVPHGKVQYGHTFTLSRSNLASATTDGEAMEQIERLRRELSHS